VASDSTPKTEPKSRNSRYAGNPDAGAIRHLWLSPWTRWIGFRYLKSKKNSRFLSFITFLSMLGVGVGVTSMIVVLSVMDGFEAELKKRLMGSELHVLVQPTTEVAGYDQGFVPRESFLDEQGIEQFRKRNPEIQSFWPVVSTEAILKVGRKVTGIVLKGVTASRLELLKPQLIESAEPQMLVRREGPDTLRLQGVFLGQELAYEMGLIPGDSLTLISPTEMEGPLGSIPRSRHFVVEGIYHSGLPEQELHTIFAPESYVRSFVRRQGAVSQWEVSVRDFEQAPAIAAKIREIAPKFRVQDWIQLNAHLFASLRLERIAMFVILAFIIVVASFNIVTTLTLMVLEKKKEIAILKAMGARHGQVAAVFLAEGLLIGGVGVVAGALLGLMICSVLRRYEFISLPDIYYDRTLPVTFDAKYYVLVSVCAILIVLAACLYPSRRAARLDPLEGIRFG
jgi:lipoprotein-releasing system permease protein